MGRRLAALLIVVMINAALLPSAAAASISEVTDITEPIPFNFKNTSSNTSSVPVAPFRWPLTADSTSSFPMSFFSDGYEIAFNTSSQGHASRWTTYNHTDFLVYQSDALVTTERFQFTLYDFHPVTVYVVAGGSPALSSYDNWDRSIYRITVSYYLVNSVSGDVVGSYENYITLPFESSWHLNLALAASSANPKTFDTVVVRAYVQFTSNKPTITDYPLVNCYLGEAWSGATVSSTSSTTVEIDGTNETLDQFFDSYQQQYDQVSAGIVTNLNTGISTIVSEARQESNSNINEFVSHSGSSEQESLDWGFRNLMIGINNAGSQVTHAVGQAASSTIAATQAAAQNVSQNIVATGETINKTLTGLPEAIGNKVTDLFVPKAEDLAAIKDDYDGLLEEKLGAVYQVEQYGQNLFGSVAAATETETITFPGISVPVGQGENFVMESAEVAVFPAGLDVLKNCVKFLVTAAFVAAWVLGLQRYYDKIMGDRGDE